MGRIPTIEERQKLSVRDFEDIHRCRATHGAKERLTPLAQLRAAGWMVAVHNDYRQGGKLMTFWLFTRGGVAVKGEGATDDEALAQVLRQVGR